MHGENLTKCNIETQITNSHQLKCTATQCTADDACRTALTYSLCSCWYVNTTNDVVRPWPRQSTHHPHHARTSTCLAHEGSPKCCQSGGSVCGTPSAHGAMASQASVEPAQRMGHNHHQYCNLHRCFPKAGDLLAPNPPDPHCGMLHDVATTWPPCHAMPCHGCHVRTWLVACTSCCMPSVLHANTWHGGLPLVLKHLLPNPTLIRSAAYTWLQL
jgi:hypothetical protein